MLLFALAAAAQPSFVCNAVSVWDGDGPITCADGTKIRLAGIATREIDNRCRRGQPCPRPSGAAARDHLVSLLGGARGRTRHGAIRIGPVPLRCAPVGTSYGRTVAWCRRGTLDLSCAMVRGGYALRWPRYGGRQVCAQPR
ncbi:endonuclease YncB(thermonuclease family) [Sphingomonas zeicaulis]|uniref:thermonuclease family protein n=1 Tax=Sphingomonas zeicaulis TaxID=1632740 RepID=UPI003D203106